MTSEWFPGPSRDAHHEAFLARLREHARRDGLVDAAPRDTAVLISVTAFSDLVVGVRAPNLPTTGPEPMLQAGYGDDDGTLYLEGAWRTHGVVLDPPDLYEPAPPGASPVELADGAFEWLTQQLHRPVDVLEFPTLVGRPQERWRFADTGEELCRTGSWLRRRRRPESVRRVR